MPNERKHLGVWYDVSMLKNNTSEALLTHVLQILDVETYTIRDSGKTIVFTGQLKQMSNDAFDQLQDQLHPYGYHALLRHDHGRDIVITSPHPTTAKMPRPWLNLVLFSLTVFTTLVAGAFMEGQVPWTSLDALLAGAPFSFSIICILGVHELGHYFAARHYKMQVTLPYFIPFIPFFPLGIGTMGAVIRMKSPMTSRRALFDVGLAGPIAGLLVAIPVLMIGLAQSELVPTSATRLSIILGKPLIYKVLRFFVVGSLPPETSIAHSSVAFAGWVGLFVTALNLLPAGQLDGGHIAYAVWGRAHRLMAQTTFIALVAMGIGPMLLGLLPNVGPVAGWSGWIVWAVLLSVFGLQHPLVLDDVTPLDKPRRIIGVIAIILMLALITPVPFSLR